MIQTSRIFWSSTYHYDIIGKCQSYVAGVWSHYFKIHIASGHIRVVARNIFTVVAGTRKWIQKTTTRNSTFFTVIDWFKILLHLINIQYSFWTKNHSYLSRSMSGRALARWQHSHIVPIHFYTYLHQCKTHHMQFINIVVAWIWNRGSGFAAIQSLFCRSLYKCNNK